MISDRMNELWGDYLESKWTTPGPIKVGSVSHWVAKPGFKLKGEWDEEVVEFELNRKMALHTVAGSKLNMGVRGDIEATANGSKVQYTEDYEVPYSILGMLVDKLSYRKAVEKFMDDVLARLKKAVET
jgi:uncharacterized membrane protein